MLNHNRGLWGYTGIAADGLALSIQSTGMGGPSAAVVASELIELGAQRLIRIGTCGGLSAELELGQLLVAAEAIADVGARPVFCEVDLATRNVTVETVRAALTPATTAIVAVDLFGVPAPCAQLRSELGLPVLEDAAQAAGARMGDRMAGALGDAATFSFYPSKNLPCFGDGGAIATDDDEIAALARSLRFHGSRDKETFEHVGYNSRLDEIQASILRILLRHLDAWSDGRRAAVSAYLEAGIADQVTVCEPPEGTLPAWHLYVVTHPRADDLLAALHAAGVQARGYYRTPLHRQPSMAPYLDGSLSLAVTDQLGAQNIALPISPVLGADQAREVVAALAAAA